MLTGERGDLRRRREHGQVAVLFALLLPVFLGLGGIVIGIGNWYTHAKHLQTKADAGAFAGGVSWAFPCGPEIDARIEAAARLYAGTNNPQVGDVPDASIHTVLNGSAWYDDDSNPTPTEFNDPANPSVCDARILDVKVTEDNSFPLFSLIPLFPDIKRKARVEIQEAEGVTGLLPIAVRAPEPVSAAAIYYNEENGDVLAVKYLVKNNSIFGLPGSLQGWSSYNPEDPSPWATFSPAAETGVVIAVSFRGACDTGLPAGNTNITTSPNPCFEDSGFATVDQLCNQGGSTQIVNCYYATGTWPSESVGAGLQFIRGYPTGDAGSGPPQLRGAWLENLTCSVSGSPGTGYFNTHPTNSCTARLHADIDIGSYDPPGPQGETRSASDTEVRYRIVTDTGTVCTFTNASCDLNGSGGPGNTSWTTQNTQPTFAANSRRNSIVMRVRLRRTTVGTTDCGQSYSAACEWFFTSAGTLTNAPTDAAALANPVQRMFRGNSVTSGSVLWLRLTTDQNCDGGSLYIDNDAASQPTGGNRCFFVDVGLKGGIAKDANEQPVLFNDGIGASQMGTLDCDPNLPQGQELIEGIKQGCNVWYARHPFDWNPLCPSANDLFSGYPTGNPGPPWDDGRWPPLRCIKTRPTSSANQMRRGFRGRFFGNENQSTCPATAPGYVKGRNYWDKDTPNGYTGSPPLGYKEGSHDTNFAPNDPRIVTIFLTTPETFTGSGQNSYPTTGFIEVYVTGFGPILGNGQVGIDDPCPGNAPPSDLDLSGGSSGGYAVWGHIIKYALPNPSATPSGVLCDPNDSLQPCVPVLVE